MAARRTTSIADLLRVVEAKMLPTASMFKQAQRADEQGAKSLALLVIRLGAVYVLVVNAFSLLFMVPLLLWLLIGQPRRAGGVLNGIWFGLGGLVVYVLFYFFGFVILRNNFAILWYLLMLFSIGTIGFPTATVITAIVAAGLSLIVPTAGAAAVPQLAAPVAGTGQAQCRSQALPCPAG